MKKVFFGCFLVFGIVLLSGCSIDKVGNIKKSGLKQEITGLNNKSTSKQIKSSKKQEIIKKPKSFDESKIEEHTEGLGVERLYKELKQYDGGYIGIGIGGNDGVTTDFIYSKSGRILKTERGILRSDLAGKNYEYCLEICDDSGCYDNKWVNKKIYSLDKCNMIFQTKCISMNGIDKDDDKKEIDCIHKTIKKIYDLINGNKKNNYLSERLKDFENKISN